MDQIVAALAIAHRQGIVHRDIKPANILLDEEDNAYLSDFGIAKDLGGPIDLTQADAITGSPAYISPEQVQSGRVTPLTDVYSLGVVLYELLTAMHPFPGESLTTLLLKHLTEPLPAVLALRPDLPPAVDEVIQRATTSFDSTVKLWDAETGQELLTLTGHELGATGVAFSPDGTRLAASGGDGTVRIYVLPIKDLMALARDRVTRSLTSEECRQYMHQQECPPAP